MASSTADAPRCPYRGRLARSRNEPDAENVRRNVMVVLRLLIGASIVCPGINVHRF